MMKVFVLASHPGSLVGFRGHFLAALRSRGHRVVAAAPGLSSDGATVDWLESNGIERVDIPLRRASTNFFFDLYLVFALVRLFRRLRPDVLFSYTVKPVTFGTIAGWLAGVPSRYALITGLGYAFTGVASGRRRLVQVVTRALYRFALRRTRCVFFQNPDDLALFRQTGILDGSVPAVVVNGSGVDLDYYEYVPPPDGPLSFLLIGRLLGDKGVREFVGAASVIKEKNPDVSFHLVGYRDQNPDSIPALELARWESRNVIDRFGLLDDVRPVIASSHVYVHPSYREGTPRAVLEAMSIGRPIITTDVPGCRETVVPEVNGYLVPPYSVEALVEAIQRFISRPELVVEMGARSRQLAEGKYDVHKVNSVLLEEMRL